MWRILFDSSDRSIEAKKYRHKKHTQTLIDTNIISKNNNNNKFVNIFFCCDALTHWKKYIYFQWKKTKQNINKTYKKTRTHKHIDNKI